MNSVWEEIRKDDILYRKQVDSNMMFYAFHMQNSKERKCNGKEAENLHFLFCKEGSITLSTNDGKLHKIHQRDILLVLEESSICKLRAEEESVFYVLTVRMAGKVHEYFQECKKTLEHMGAILFCSDLSWNYECHRILQRLSKEERAEYCLIKSMEMSYLASKNLLFWKAQSIQYSNHEKSQAQAIGHYIDTHLSEDLTIPTLCKKFCISNTKLKQSFATEYQTSVHRWISQRRMERAAELLLHTDQTILEIAQMVGYGSISQFNMKFKETYQMQPSKFRKHRYTAREKMTKNAKK